MFPSGVEIIQSRCKDLIGPRIMVLPPIIRRLWATDSAHDERVLLLPWPFFSLVFRFPVCLAC
jgi:hypothetical protein